MERGLRVRVAEAARGDHLMYTLQWMAEAGYVLGLETIGEVWSHMQSHYDAYFLLDVLVAQLNQQLAVVRGHLDDRVDDYLTPEDKARMDKELDEVLTRSADAQEAREAQEDSFAELVRVSEESETKIPGA
jgi:hypothetical protein